MAEHAHRESTPLAVGLVPRRAFLAGTGLIVASAATAAAGAPLFGPRAAAAHDDCACLTSWRGVWSLAKVDSGYVSLAGEIDSRSFKLHEILAAPNGTVQLGKPRDVKFPDDFVPSVLHGVGARLLVGGAKVVEAQRITVDYSVSQNVAAGAVVIGYNPPYPDGVHELSIPTFKPALYEISGKHLTELPIGDVANTVGWGSVTDIVTVPGSGLAIRIEGSGSYEAAYGERVIVAETAGGGATWFSDTVVTGLGEGWAGGLALSNGTLVAITVDQDKRRTMYQRSAATRAAWNAVDAGTDGVVLGAVSGPGGSVIVFSSVEDRIVRQRYDATSRQWFEAKSDAAAGATTHAVMTVGGAPGEWLAVGQASARLIKETI